MTRLTKFFSFFFRPTRNSSSLESRRRFLQGMIAVTAAVAVAPAFPRFAKKLSSKASTRLSDTEKELIIRGALDTEEGRMALAMSMVEPIRRSLNYQAVGRKIFGVEELPAGAVAYAVNRERTAIMEMYD